MPRENQEKLSEMRMNYLKATLELRKELVAKQLEITMHWAQANVDSAKVEELSIAVAKLQEELGGSDWTCPGFWQ